MIDWHKPSLVALLETKMQCHQALLEDFSFNRMIEVSANGNSRGIVVLWDDNFLKLDDTATTAQEVHAMIKVHNSPHTWLVSCVYASTYRCNRKILWQNLKNIKNNFSGMWLIGGDFNELLSNSEKRAGIPSTIPIQKTS